MKLLFYQHAYSPFNCSITSHKHLETKSSLYCHRGLYRILGKFSYGLGIPTESCRAHIASQTMEQTLPVQVIHHRQQEPQR